MWNISDMAGGKPMAISTQTITGVSAVNPVVAFYDIHWKNRDLMFFFLCPEHNTNNTLIMTAEVA
jgi:hypothetical protein